MSPTHWSLVIEILKGSYIPGIEEVCVIEGDLSGCKLIQTGALNMTYCAEFSLAIYFGGTTLRAKLFWDKDVSAV